MSRVLLSCGGVLNAIFFLFHLFLGYRIAHMQEVPPVAMGMLNAFNVGSAMFIFFLAFVSLFLQKELTSTAIGKGVLMLAALSYLARAAEEFIFFKFHPTIFVTCLITGLIYAAVWALAAEKTKASAAAA